MDIEKQIVLVTGANRGIGAEFARQAIAMGARKVYAGARDPSSVNIAGAIPVRLDVTQEAEVISAAQQCPDVTVLVNNAGIGEPDRLLHQGALASLQRHMDVNVLGMLRMTQAFAPVLARHNGGAILNVLSVVSWINAELLPTYSVSKAAAWSLSNGLRNELRAQGTQVTNLHMGFVDTDLTKQIAAAKTPANDIVKAALAALIAGQDECMADELTKHVKHSLSTEQAMYLRRLGA